MNVCMLLWNYWPGMEGGTEKQCRQLTHLLSEMKVSCRVVTHWNRFGSPRHEDDGNARVLRLGVAGPMVAWTCRIIGAGRNKLSRASSFKGPASGHTEPMTQRVGLSTPLIWIDRLIFMVEAYVYLKRHRDAINVLHVHESHWIAGFGAWAGGQLNIPVIVKEATYPTLADLPPGVPFKAAINRWRMRAHYFAQTTSAALDLEQKGIQREYIQVIPNGVTLPPDPVNTMSARTVTCVGNLYQGAAWKGFDVLLKAWTHVHNRHVNARLMMVGAGSPVVWQDMAKELNISSSVVFRGEVGSLGEIFSETAILVSSSRQEGMPNTVLEAQAWGLPVVVTDIPGSRDIVLQGETGCVVPPNDPDRLGEALVLLLDDDHMRKRMGVRGREHVREKFSFENIARQVMAAYQGLLNG